MSIKLRLAVAFTAAAAILFTLGSWLFIAGLSSSLLSSIDSQLAARLSTAGRGRSSRRARARSLAASSSRLNGLTR